MFDDNYVELNEYIEQIDEAKKNKMDPDPSGGPACGHLFHSIFADKLKL